MAPTRKPSALRSLLSTRDGRFLWGLVALLTVATVVGLVVLRPHGHGVRVHGAPQGDIRGRVAEVSSSTRARVLIQSGPDKGSELPISYGSPIGTMHVSRGQRVRMARLAPIDDGLVRDPKGSYTDLDHDRQRPTIALLVVFAVLGVIVGRGRGLLALLGTALSVLLVATWLVPAILDGRSPTLCALVAGFAVMLITVFLTYGITAQSLAASLGIGTALLLAAAVSVIWTHWAFLDGSTDTLGEFEITNNVRLPLEGVTIAGMVIGALGAITDTAIAQVSTVAALHRAHPDRGARHILREAMGVGRDHLSASIHTLAMAYAGAALPLLLLASVLGYSGSVAINDQSLAEPLIATLAGATAVVAAVPLTTSLAAALIARLPVAALPEDRGHSH